MTSTTDNTPPAAPIVDADTRVPTDRLVLLPATAEIARADASDSDRLGSMLGVVVPKCWPPELYGEHREQLAAILESRPTESGWWSWYITYSIEGLPAGTLVGSVGFSGPPDADGHVQIGYAILQDYRGQGFATEALGGLIDWAFENTSVQRISGETFSDMPVSISVMTRNNMKHVGEGSEPGTLRYEISRQDWEA
jgi:[ribosomal protein S5]-alanine N-acetyltransferase